MEPEHMPADGHGLLPPRPQHEQSFSQQLAVPPPHWLSVAHMFGPAPAEGTGHRARLPLLAQQPQPSVSALQ